jgi:uncharacterized SAM-binding protein YcdF (DUF218 family)
MRSDRTTGANEGASRKSARAEIPRSRRVIAVLASLVLLAVIAVGVGFVWFVDRLPAAEPATVGSADGIVVLTGRASRIADAIGLLAAKRGQRLLISGVYPKTTAAAIARLMPEHQSWFDCCVDLDHSAVNTEGNAVQTRKWARQHSFKSLIVVTSNYHMPRAMIEISHQLPDVELIAFPITPEWVRVETWWSRLAMMRLLFAEYLKFLRAAVRTQTSRVLPPPSV